ncbi:hypothetical protein M8J77_023519 [Diaphorina citri]|nr:hypothetical protein M8J77_023519 [Diaphorina citri]
MMTKVNINCEQTTGNLSTSLNQWTTPRNENLIKKEQETMTIYDADYIHLNHPPNLFDINKKQREKQKERKKNYLDYHCIMDGVGKFD